MPTSCPAVPPDDVPITFTVLENNTKVTVAEAREMSFGTGLGRSMRDGAEVNETTRSRFKKVCTATLYRFILHMKDALKNMLAANSRHECASMCMKWDETQQPVSIGLEAVISECGGAADDWKTVVLMHVITFGIAFKHTALQRPYRFYVPPMAMHRTTAECLWVAFCRAYAIGPWLGVPNADFACFMWYIFCADEASSNLRFFAACETRL